MATDDNSSDQYTWLNFAGYEPRRIMPDIPQDPTITITTGSTSGNIQVGDQLRFGDSGTATVTSVTTDSTTMTSDETITVRTTSDPVRGIDPITFNGISDWFTVNYPRGTPQTPHEFLETADDISEDQWIRIREGDNEFTLPYYEEVEEGMWLNQMELDDYERYQEWAEEQMVA